MKQFLQQLSKFLIIIFIPLCLLTVGYLLYDPFSVLKPKRNYYNLKVLSNRDFVSTEMFIKNNPLYHYNAFIFGSSRTLGYAPLSWKKYLPADAVPFVFDASGESVYGIYKKLQFLQRKHIPIKYALIVLDRDVSFDNNKNHKGHLFIKHPLISEESKFDFNMEFYKAYLNPKFLFNFYYYTFSKHYKPFMKGFIENRNVIYDTVTNQIILANEDKAMLENPIKYYENRTSSFQKPKSADKDIIKRIDAKEIKFLLGIKEILNNYNTDFKIVVSPLFEQIRLNKCDDSTLSAIFKNKYFNFSGKNTFTNDQSNYYESNHFTPKAGEIILKLIYTTDTISMQKKILQFQSR